MLFADILRLGERKHAKTIRAGAGLMVLETLCAAVPYVALYGALDLVLAGRTDRVGPFLALAGVAVTGLLAQYLFGLYAARLSITGGYALMAGFRVSLAEHISRLPLGVLTRSRVGQLNALISDNVRMIEDMFTHVLGEMTAAVVLPACVAVLLLVVDWRMGLAAIATVPVAWAVLLLSRRRFARLSAQRLAGHDDVAAALLEYIDGMPVLRSCGAEGDKFRTLSEAMHGFRRISSRLEAWGGASVVGFAVILELGFAALLAAGTYLVLGGEVERAAFLMAMVLAQKFYAPMTRAGMLMAEGDYLGRAVDKVKAVMDLAPLPEPAQPARTEGTDVTFDAVTFGYDPGRSVLDDVSVTIPAGKVTALVGPSGAGKTTLVHLTARFHDPDAGAVRLGGVDLCDLGSEQVMAKVAMVLQDVHLFDDTVAANIRLGRPEATDAEVRRAAEVAQCHDFITALPQGYDTRIGEDGARLSGGQKQRLSIARALLKDAPVLLLDEGTASVDVETELAFHRAFARPGAGKTVVMIAHRLSSIVHADQILVMDGGRIVERGSHAGLLAAGGLYADLWRAATCDQDGPAEEPAGASAPAAIDRGA
ncbi:ABC transporter ATP-binding protein [Rhodospira trueperi]|uniref:ATP-binding cassette, subfamily B n=1 Tax=Rhodospira trueperi TaxID=69960 RepID=A0A1G7DL67_9PROT|nr:ABC transporter ATP-binding protein [Rhodospira trueperi]SDE51515.1 ATP-binding cassette, subfamily B [Rhodospira trueperi]